MSGPCASQRDYAACCGPIIEGSRLAETAEPVLLPAGPEAPPLPSLGVPAQPPTGRDGPAEPPGSPHSEGSDDDG